MNRMMFKYTLMACLSLGILSSGIRAEEKKTEPTKEGKEEEMVEKSPGALAAEALFLAQQMADYGRQTKSAESLAMAALIIAQTPHEVGEIPKEFLEGVTVKKYDPKAEANALLAEAKKIDPQGKAVSDIAAKVADLHTENRRSVSGGAKTYPTMNIAIDKPWTFAIPAKYAPNVKSQWSLQPMEPASASGRFTLSMTSTTTGKAIRFSQESKVTSSSIQAVVTFIAPSDGKITVGVIYKGPTNALWGGKSAPFRISTY